MLIFGGFLVTPQASLDLPVWKMNVKNEEDFRGSRKKATNLQQIVATNL